MANYTVTIDETIFHTVDVEADSENIAVDMAMDIVTGDSTDYDTDSQGISTWTVEVA